MEGGVLVSFALVMAIVEEAVLNSRIVLLRGSERLSHLCSAVVALPREAFFCGYWQS